MKKQIIKKVIDSSYLPDLLYRFHVEFADGSTCGSCYCYESYKEAIKAMEQTLKWSNK